VGTGTSHVSSGAHEALARQLPSAPKITCSKWTPGFLSLKDPGQLRFPSLDDCGWELAYSGQICPLIFSLAIPQTLPLSLTSLCFYVLFPLSVFCLFVCFILFYWHWGLNSGPHIC
jgi:hypothetical protein